MTPFWAVQKLACGEGGCGACAVVLSGPGSGHTALSVNSCLRPLGAMHGWAVTTIEGLASTCKGEMSYKRSTHAERIDVNERQGGIMFSAIS